MPCYDYRDAIDQRMSHRANAILCAILRKHGAQLLNDLDYTQMGLTAEQVAQWQAWHDDADKFYETPGAMK